MLFDHVLLTFTASATMSNQSLGLAKVVTYSAPEFQYVCTLVSHLLVDVLIE